MIDDIRPRLQQRDSALIWHPYSPSRGHTPGEDGPLVIQRGLGASLFDPYGREYLDLVSSWWVNVHGHAHPKIAQALYQQALTLEHVMFADITHEPAIQLAENLQKRLPDGFSKFFYSDNGSTAVEVALKILYQYWQIQQQPQRTRFLAFDGGYHGDTLGAMSVGQGCGFFTTFEKLLFPVDLIPYPATWQDDEAVNEKESMALSALQSLLAQKAKTYAGCIIEPLVQGASGMRFARPCFVSKLVTLCQDAGVPVIFDEVMTGFGRTGTLWACDQIDAKPDILCLSKGITGGFLPLAVTVCQQSIADVFQGPARGQAFLHGHSYTANPLACAVGLASLALFDDENTLQSIQTLEARHRHTMQQLASHPRVTRMRTCGSILAFDLAESDGRYGSALSQRVRQAFIKRGMVLRPLGSTIYLMPPACLTESQYQRAVAVILEVLSDEVFEREIRQVAATETSAATQLF